MGDVRRTLDGVWRIESARLIAGIARVVRDVGVAEDLAQEAFVAALEQWPESGVPDNPGAWLMATAKHRAIDRLRRSRVQERKTQELAREIERRGDQRGPGSGRRIDDPFDDDLLRLIFTACHPVLSTDARVALTLRLLGGLTTTEIARAYLVSGGHGRPADRARQAHAIGGASAVRDPRATRARRPARLGARGRSTSSSTRATPPPPASGGCGPSCSRRRCVWGASSPSCSRRSPRSTALSPSWSSRRRARGRGSGLAEQPVLLLDQDRSRWDWMLVRRGLAALERAYRTGGAAGPTRCRRRSPPATPAPAPPRRPTGNASSLSTTGWPS